MTITIAQIRRYPVKGLTAETMNAAELSPGRGLPDDRRFAIALGSTPVDGPRIDWMPKTSFLSLLRHEKLAMLKARFDGASGVLTIERGGRQVARGKITEPIGRAMIEEFFDAYMGPEARGRPRLVEAAASSVLSDHSTAVVSLINLASVRDLERVTGRPVDPVRFRGNLYFEGAEPWIEHGWVGRDIDVGGVRLAIAQAIDRCPATNVDPETGARDLNVPADLKRGFGHVHMGVYGAVAESGTVTVGDAVTPPA